MRTPIHLSWVLVAAVGCGSSNAGNTQQNFNECRDASDGTIDCTVTLQPPDRGYHMETAPRVLQPGEERLICSVVELTPSQGEEVAWINEIHSLSSEGSHHMNVYFSADWTFADFFAGQGASEIFLGFPQGTYDCDELGDLMESAFPFAPSQRADQRLQFPDRVGMPWFVPSIVVIEQHFVNLRERPAKVNAAVNFIRIDQSEVDELIGILWASDWNINIPPEHQSLTAATCIAPFDANVAIISTHTHARGRCATVNRYDGSTGLVEQTPFFVNKDWERPPILHFPRGEYPIKKGDGFHYGCHYYNAEKDRTITGGGTSRDEMCMAVSGIYPVEVTKQQVLEVAESRILSDAYALIDRMILSCDRAEEEPESPWEMAGQAVPGPVDTCADYPATEGNTLR